VAVAARKAARPTTERGAVIDLARRRLPADTRLPDLNPCDDLLTGTDQP
jgi:hypothetical protein